MDGRYILNMDMSTINCLRKGEQYLQIVFHFYRTNVAFNTAVQTRLLVF